MQRNEEFNTVLNEANDALKGHFNLSAIGQDISSVLVDDNAFDVYRESLTANMDAQDQEKLSTMMSNAREEILRESALSSVTPFASLNMPILVQLWARLTMTQAIPTEPTSVPAFTVSWIKPFIMGKDGQKYYLPEAINAYSDAPELTGKRPLKQVITATDGKIKDVNLLTASGVTADEIKKQVGVARGIALTGASWSDSFDAETKATGAMVTFNLKTKMVEDTNSNFYGEVTYVTAVDEHGVPTQATDTLMGHINHETGVLSVTSLSGKLTAVKVKGFVSEEQHTFATNVSFDITKEEIQVPTSSHVEASLPFEFIQDVNAMYSIDGAAQVVDEMSGLVQQQVDLDIINFLQEAYESTDAMYHRTFDAVPGSDYAIGPVEWRKQLRSLIDFLAQSMRQDYKGYDMTFNIVGNPLDTMLLPDVDWKFENGSGTVNGVSVSYGYGAISGVASYKVISSDLIQQGDLKIIGVPQRPDYKGFVYYPYSFTTTNSYQNSVNNALPSVVMSKRYALKEFMPLIADITIKNNDGNIWAR